MMMTMFVKRVYSGKNTGRSTTKYLKTHDKIPENPRQYTGKPSKPVEPGEPVDRGEPGEPGEPVEPGESGEPGEPVEPGEPAEPGESVESGEPVEPQETNNDNDSVRPSGVSRGKNTPLILPMVFILDGYSIYHAHIWSK